MHVDRIMSKHIHTCGPQDALDSAVRVMHEHDVGVVPIVDGARHVVGIITDRDACMAVYTRGKPLSEIPIESVMSRKIVSAHPEDSMEHAQQLMREARVRRLPVVDQDGRLTGLLSQNDLVREAARERMVIGKHITTDEVARTLDAIGHT